MKDTYPELYITTRIRRGGGFRQLKTKLETLAAADSIERTSHVDTAVYQFPYQVPGSLETHWRSKISVLEPLPESLALLAKDISSTFARLDNIERPDTGRPAIPTDTFQLFDLLHGEPRHPAIIHGRLSTPTDCQNDVGHDAPDGHAEDCASRKLTEHDRMKVDFLLFCTARQQALCAGFIAKAELSQPLRGATSDLSRLLACFRDALVVWSKCPGHPDVSGPSVLPVTAVVAFETLEGTQANTRVELGPSGIKLYGRTSKATAIGPGQEGESGKRRRLASTSDDQSSNLESDHHTKRPRAG